jgi:predicted regulator of Ras-like GTPase activity (Roadblock/LC7/MglB family)
MEEALAEINAVAGVRGSFVCDNLGTMIVSAVMTGLDASFDAIGREVTQTMAALETAGEAVSELDFSYEGARLVAHDLEKAVLVVLCEPEVEIAMLRLTLSVVMARLKGDAETQSRLEARAEEKEVVQDEVDEISWHLLEVLKEGR